MADSNGLCPTCGQSYPGSEYDEIPAYTVDENGCEWWLDDDQKWWFRTPEMDDWMEHTGEQ